MSEPMPLEGDTEGGLLNRLGDTLWGVSDSNHILYMPDCEFNAGKMNPLGWFKDQ